MIQSVQCAVANQGGTTGKARLNFDIRRFVKEMDAVIGLLDSAADALAATWGHAEAVTSRDMISTQD